MSTTVYPAPSEGEVAALDQIALATSTPLLVAIVDDNGDQLGPGLATLPVSGTISAIANGLEIHGQPLSGNPVFVGFEARSADGTAVDSGDAVRALATILGKLVVKLDALPGQTWQYAAAAGGLVTTSGVTAKAAGAAGVRNYVKSIDVINSHATISTEVVVRDGAAGTVIHRGWAQAGGGGYAKTFDPPLRGSTATLVEIAEVTATATTGVLVNLQGFQAAE